MKNQNVIRLLRLTNQRYQYRREEESRLSRKLVSTHRRHVRVWWENVPRSVIVLEEDDSPISFRPERTNANIALSTRRRAAGLHHTYRHRWTRPKPLVDQCAQGPLAGMHFLLLQPHSPFASRVISSAILSKQRSIRLVHPPGNRGDSSQSNSRESLTRTIAALSHNRVQ